MRRIGRPKARFVWHRISIGRGGALTLLAATISLLMSIQVAASQAASPVPQGDPGQWSLKLNEEFTSTGLNHALWTPGWQRDGNFGESERCVYPELVSQPGDGYLHLALQSRKATCEWVNTKGILETIHPAYAGSLVESNPGDGVTGHTGFAYSYGFVEWRVDLPGAKGGKCPNELCIANWPALWSLPASHSDEIDTMEGLEEGIACYHFHPPYEGPNAGKCIHSTSYTGWHTFGADWRPSGVTYYYDGVDVGEQQSEGNNPEPQYLVMDLVSEFDGAPTVAPSEMLVDYVRVWQRLSPTVTLGAPTDLTPESVQLNGKVDPNGTETHYQFQYGETAPTEHSIPTTPGDLGEPSEELPTTAQLSSLKPGTTYHYREVATNSSGGTSEADGEFTTPAPPDVNTDPATEIELTQATLNGYVNPHLADTRYYFQYGTTLSYGSNVPALPGEDAGSGNSAIPVKATPIELAPGTTYHFRIVASNEWGTHEGPDEVFRTAAWGAAVAKSGGEALAMCVGGVGTPTGCVMAPGAEAPGTSPSVAQLSDGSAAEALVGAGDLLTECHVTYSGGSSCYASSIVVASGSNPGVAEIANGNAIVAVNTASGLQFCEATATGPVNCANAGWSPRAGASPVVASLSDGSAVVGFVNSGGDLTECHVTYSGGSSCYPTSITVATETNPSIAWLPGNQGE